MTWKDLEHPLAGGAEVVNEELAKRLAKDGHEVKLITGGFSGAKAKKIKDGYEIIRLGNRVTVYWQAYRYYKKNLQGWADVVIDEINTIPFFAKWYVKEPNMLFVHQLCREIWFYQLPKWLGWLGYITEPLYLRLLNDRKVITVSESTKQDLLRLGFQKANIHIISEGLSSPALAEITAVQKFETPTILSHGSMRAMKRTLEQVKAFEIAKRAIPDLQLKLSGDASDAYGQKVLRYIEQSPYRDAIEYLGRTSNEVRDELMQKAHLITVTSVREGWGLIVTEANSKGTPAVVYDVAGLRDSVKHGDTGHISTPTPEALAEGIVTMLTDKQRYESQRQAAWQWSKTITFTQSYKDFTQALETI